MEFISLFTRLLSEKTNASPATIKNYRADLNHFIKWFEKKQKSRYSPEKVTQQILSEYKTGSKLAHTSLKRRIAALKKFHDLLEGNSFTHNPFKEQINTPAPLIDLKDVENFLLQQKASPLTRKNYLGDLRAFLRWTNEVACPKYAKEILTPQMIEEYKERLRTLHTPPSTINRKLSSIRKLHDYAQAAGIVPTEAYQTQRVNDNVEVKSLTLSDIEKLKSAENTYSKIPPVRLFQRLLNPYFELEDRVATKIALRLKKHEKKTKFQVKEPHKNFITNPRKLTVEDVTRHLYAPISAPQNTTFKEKIFHHTRHTRPKWYKRYHSFTASHYLHFGLLIIGTIIAGYTLYQGSIGKIFSEDSALAANVSPPKILAFQGTLTSEEDIPISTPSTVQFTIYSTEFENTPLWQESQLVTPDNTGTFTTYLGTKSPIDTQIFADNSQLYLGVRLEGQEELRPRQRLANVAFAANSEYLQGLAPITQEGAGSKNVVLALDSAGNLTIPGEGTRTFRSQGGNIKLSGQSVILTSNAASDGDIVLAPDGSGGIDIQNSIINTSQNGAIWPGSVTFEDETVVSATSSAKPAFAVLQDSTGDIFTASSAGITRFVVDKDGRVGINTDSPTEYLQINNGSIFLQGGGGRIYGDTLKVESTGTSPLLIQPSGSSTGNVGIGTTSPTAFTHIQGGTSTTPLLKLNFTGTRQNIIDAQKSGTTVFTLSENGNIGLGTTTTSSRITLATSTSATGGISFGDTNLYRSASSTLQTDNSLIVAGDLTVDGTTTINSVTYTWPDADGSPGQVLTTDGAGTLTWTAVSGGTNYFQRNANSVSPLNITDDILVGATSTASALIRLPGTVGEDVTFNTGGNVGIGTTTPGQALEVDGNLRLDFTGTATTNGICHSGASSDTTATDRDLVVCSSAPADYAEWYAADTAVEAGDIVELSSNIISYEAEGADAQSGQVHSLGKQDIAVLQKASHLDKVLGVVSTAPFQTIGADIKKALVDSLNYKAVPLALNGRVLLKIAHNSPEIEAGDPLTLSASAAGKATKATSPTFIVARALEPWNKDKDAILAYVQPTWYQPLALTENGANKVEKDASGKYFAVSGEQVLENIIAGARLTAARIQAGTIIASEITVEATLTATEVIASRLKVGAVEAGEITTQALSVTSDNLTIAGKSLQEYIDERISQAQNSQLTQNLPENLSLLINSELEAQNSASVSGNLTAESISTQGEISANSASISGTLEADKLITGKIEDLEEKIASISGVKATESGKISEETGLPADQPSEALAKEGATTKEILTETKIENIETDSNGLAILPSLKSTFAIFEHDLTVFGTSTLNEATVLDTLTIGTGNTSLTIGSNSLNSLETLEIQPLAQASLSFMGGKVVLDTQGNLTIGGDTLISGTLAARDAIFQDGLLTTEVQAGIISPLPDNDLAVRLGEKEDGSTQKFEVQNASGTAVLSVDNKGNVEASGAATFAKLNFWDPEEAYAEVSDTEIETQGSAGKASIKANRRELTIHNPNVTEKSLIYLTPAGNTQNKVVYLLRQVPGESFTVGITTPAASDVEFNWLIVN